MNSLPVTSMVAALLACLMFVLTVLISIRRVELGKQSGDIAKFVFGHGDDETLRRRVRAFGNFIEYTPVALLLLALIEFQGAGYLLLWWLGAAFVIGRLLHALGMLFCPRFPLPRAIGMFATYATLLIPAGWMLTNLH
ncbi:MAG: MAPEG family protein [Pseudomonadales bacterium]|nr:MAPEG family protein [Pseudomonadales bacterium]